MTATIEEIHRDPSILDRAITCGEAVHVFQEGKLLAHFTPEKSAGGAAPGKAVRTIPHRFGFAPGIELDGLNRLADELEVEARAEKLMPR